MFDNKAFDMETKTFKNCKSSDRKKNINFTEEYIFVFIKPKRNESFFSEPSHKNKANKALIKN